jgi:hypothetical protein
MWYVDGIGVVKTPRSITRDNIQYPKNIFTLWTKTELAAIGIKPARVVKYDRTYAFTGAVSWDTSGDEVIGTYASTDKDPDDLKSAKITDVKNIVMKRISSTDWMVIREADGGAAIPDDVKTYRAELRATSNAKEAEINALTDLDSVKEWDSAGGAGFGWPEDPND